MGMALLTTRMDLAYTCIDENSQNSKNISHTPCPDLSVLLRLPHRLPSKVLRRSAQCTHKLAPRLRSRIVGMARE